MSPCRAPSRSRPGTSTASAPGRTGAGLDRRASSPTCSACRRSRRRPIRFRCSSASWRATGATGTAPRATRASALHVRKALAPGAARVRASRVRLRDPDRDRAHAGGDRSRPSTSRTAARTSRRRCGSWRRSSSSRPSISAEALPLVLCGDLNVARTDMDVHPKERKPRAIGQRPEERALLERIIAAAWSTSAARSTPTTTACSRGGRRGATCASATSAGGSTTCWPASSLFAQRARLACRSASSAPAITRRWWRVHST